MATFTPNKGYALPQVDGDSGLWGTLVNGTTSQLDKNMGGNGVISVAGGANVTASAAQAQNLIQTLTGALTAAIEYILPALGGFYIINNQTTGAFVVTVLTSAVGSTGVVVQQGATALVYSDGTNILSATSSLAPDVGDMKFTSAATPPSLWYFCAGQAVSRTTYAALFAVIGTTFGTGDGSTTFNLPDMRGRSAFGADAMGGTAANRLTTTSLGTAAVLGVTGGNELLHQHFHNVTDPGHNHGVNDPGHGHGVSDGGHAHQIFSESGPPGSNGATSGLPFVAVAISTGGGAVGTQASTTGIGIQTAETSVSVATGAANISIQNAGSGGSQNLPPALVANWVIYAGA